MKLPHLLILGLLLSLAGCGVGAGGPDFSYVSQEAGQAPTVRAPAGGEAAPPNQPPPAPAGVERKIIYNANLRLVIEDFDQGVKALTELVKQADGLIASSEIRGSPGAPRTGVWTVRVPVQKFNSFRDAVLELGEPETNSLTSQDVTEEYYDVKARIANFQKEEQRLLQHLDKDTKDLKDILEVEREVSRVRGEIERMQGRQRVLENLSSLTTVTITLVERLNYVPPQAPGFGTSVGRTFFNSLDALQRAGEMLVLAVVALAPWLAVLAVLALPVWLARRAFRPQLPDAVIVSEVPAETRGTNDSSSGPG